MNGMENDTVVLPSATRTGQGTAIEQSRAVAEVQGAIIVAQRCPRNVPAAIAQIEESCRQTALADKAFFRYPRGKDDNGKANMITGPTVHLARELARCWGNIQYGLVELRRDDDYYQSEMQAWAWDVQTNTRVSHVFIVPHKRFARGKLEPLVDLRDIYENNSNNGARRVREQIFAVLPPWIVDMGKDLCSRTLDGGGGVPLPKRIAEAIERFDKNGVRVDQLERKLGVAAAEWTPHDVAQLGIIWTSLSRGETTAAEEFPPPRVTMEELNGPGPAAEQSEPEPPQGPDIFHPENCGCPVCVHFGLAPGPDGTPLPGHVDVPVQGCPVCQELAAEADRQAAAE